VSDNGPRVERPTDKLATLRGVCRDYFGTDDPADWLDHLSTLPCHHVEFTRRRCNGRVKYRVSVGWKLVDAVWVPSSQRWKDLKRRWKTVMSSLYDDPSDAAVDACYDYVTDPSHAYAGASQTNATPTEVAQ
jgi:hypothetical protein